MMPSSKKSIFNCQKAICSLTNPDFVTVPPLTDELQTIWVISYSILRGIISLSLVISSLTSFMQLVLVADKGEMLDKTLVFL